MTDLDFTLHGLREIPVNSYSHDSVDAIQAIAVYFGMFT